MRSCEVPKGGAKSEGCKPALVPSDASNSPSPHPLPRRLTTLKAHAPCGGGAEVGVAVKMVRAKCAVASIRNLFFWVSLRAAEGGEAISALMRRAGTRRSRRPFWPPRRDTATCWPNLFTEVVVHALSASGKKGQASLPGDGFDGRTSSRKDNPIRANFQVGFIPNGR